MKRTFAMMLVGIACLLLASPSWARDLYLNGKLINGVRSQKFVNVTVRIDGKGNVYIIGKQYKVQYGNKKPQARTAKPAKTAKTTAQPKAEPKKQPTAQPAPRQPANTGAPQPRPEKSYVVVAQRDAKQGSGYRINLLINDKKVRTILAQLPQDVFDVTPYLKKGENKVVVEAIKVNPKAKGTFSMYLTVGTIAKGVVKIQKPYVWTYKREAKETRSYRHIYNVTVK